MASQENTEPKRLNNASSQNSTQQRTQTSQTLINATQNNHSPAPEIQPGSNVISGGNDATTTVGQATTTTDTTGTSGLNRNVNPERVSDGCSVNSDPSPSGPDHLVVANGFEEENSSTGSGQTYQSPSVVSRDGHCFICNGSDSGYSSSSSLQNPPGPKFFLDSETLKNADDTSNLWGPRILYTLYEGAGPAKETRDLADLLKKDLDPSERAKLLMQVTKKLPELMVQKRWTELALFLPLDDVRAKAIECLETLLMDLRNNQDSSVRDHLLQVAATSKEVILDLGDCSPSLLPMMTLHLITLSALLSRCPQPDQGQFSALAISKKQSKKKGGEGLKQTVLKTLQTFHEGLEDLLDQTGSVRDGIHWELLKEDKEKRKTVMTQASVCKKIVSIYSLLNEVKHHRWNKEGGDLLEVLQDAYVSSTSSGSTKGKQSEECKAALAFFLAHLLTHLLKRMYDRDKPQVGTQDCRHQEQISNMLLAIAENANNPVKDYILKEVKSFPFHKATNVQKTFSKFWNKRESSSVLVQQYMLENLQLIGFSLPNPGNISPESQRRVDEKCHWKKTTCIVGKSPAEATMYIPKPGCFGSNQLEACLREHPGHDEYSPEDQERLREESQSHLCNLDMLKELSPRSKHVLNLYSYQILPFPMYITEQVSHRRLLDHLLAHRENLSWLNTYSMKRIASQLTEVMIFFFSRDLDPRGVTCYNVIVQPGPGSQDGQALTSEAITIKLTDLGRTHQFIDKDLVYENMEIRPVDDQGLIPVRWLAPEALFEGQYGGKNMVYNLACLFYELWTHGLQPYSSYDKSMSTVDILQKMLTQPGSVKLASPPCIPEKMFKLIEDCTAHSRERRPPLDVVLNTVVNLPSEEPQRGQKPGLVRTLSLRKRYPEISQCQTNRRHIPEEGIPKPIQDLLLAGRDSDLYSRAKRISVISPSVSNVVTEQELKPSDRIHISHLDNRTVVEEELSPSFVRDVLPSIRASDQYGVTCYRQTDDRFTTLCKKNGLHVHKREYPASVTLESAAREDLWESVDPASAYDEEESELGVLKPLISLARVLRDLHQKGWLARDLREEYILVDKQTGEVMLPRIARMIHLGSDKYVVDEVPEDIRRRAGPEVLVNGRYGKENDIYMLGVVMLQLYRIREIVTSKPRARCRDFAPCPNIHKDELTNYIRDPNLVREVKPMQCPDWFYSLSMRCCHSDPEKRPTAYEVHDALREHWTDGPLRTPFIKRSPTPVPEAADEAQDEADASDTVQLRPKSFPNRKQPSLFQKITERFTRKLKAGDTIFRPSIKVLQSSKRGAGKKQTPAVGFSKDLEYHSDERVFPAEQRPDQCPQRRVEHWLYQNLSALDAGSYINEPSEGGDSQTLCKTRLDTAVSDPDQISHLSLSEETTAKVPEQLAIRATDAMTTKSNGPSRHCLESVEEAGRCGSRPSDTSSSDDSGEHTCQVEVDVHAEESSQTSSRQNNQDPRVPMQTLSYCSYLAAKSQGRHLLESSHFYVPCQSKRLQIWHPITGPPTETSNRNDEDSTWPKLSHEVEPPIPEEEMCEELYDSIEDPSSDEEDSVCGARAEINTGSKALQSKASNMLKGFQSDGYDCVHNGCGRTGIAHENARALSVMNENSFDRSHPDTDVTLQPQARHQIEMTTGQTAANGTLSRMESERRWSSKKRSKKRTRKQRGESKQGRKMAPTSQLPTRPTEPSGSNLENPSRRHASRQDPVKPLTSIEQARFSCSSGCSEDDYPKLRYKIPRPMVGENKTVLEHSQRNNQRTVYTQDRSHRVNPPVQQVSLPKHQVSPPKHQAHRDHAYSVRVSEERSPLGKQTQRTAVLNRKPDWWEECTDSIPSAWGFTPSSMNTFAANQSMISSRPNFDNVRASVGSRSRAQIMLPYDVTSRVQTLTSSRNTGKAGDENDLDETYDEPTSQYDFPPSDHLVSRTGQSLTTASMTSPHAFPRLPVVSASATLPGSTSADFVYSLAGSMETAASMPPHVRPDTSAEFSRRTAGPGMNAASLTSQGRAWIWRTCLGGMPTSEAPISGPGTCVGAPPRAFTALPDAYAAASSDYDTISMALSMTSQSRQCVEAADDAAWYCNRQPYMVTSSNSRQRPTDVVTEYEAPGSTRAEGSDCLYMDLSNDIQTCGASCR